MGDVVIVHGFARARVAVIVAYGLLGLFYVFARGGGASLLTSIALSAVREDPLHVSVS
jgi:hypothetical protein